MKASKKQLEEAIIFFAEKFKQKESYEILIGSFVIALPELIKMIVYEMFVNEFNPHFCEIEERWRYELILECATELKENGFIRFES